jgi:hypothetical protein
MLVNDKNILIGLLRILHFDVIIKEEKQFFK